MITAMKVLNLKRIEKYPDRRLYTFSLLLSPFIVNGFVYNADKGAILAPKCGGKRVVRSFGIHWKRLREQLNAALAQVFEA